MTGGVVDTRTIAAAEPSFHSSGESQGTFEIAGRAARVWIDRDRWLGASVEAPYEQAHLVRSCSAVLQPVKVIAGPGILAEVPCDDDVGGSFTVVRTALRAAIAAVESPRMAPGAGEAAAIEGRFPEAVLDESRFEWCRGDGARTTSHGSTRIDLDIREGAVVFRTRLARLRRELSGDSTAALADFLIAFNGLLRFARAIVLEREIALEVAIPIAVLVPALVDRAVDALAIGAAAAKPSCVALIDHEVGRWYLEFHKKGRFECRP